MREVHTKAENHESAEARKEKEDQMNTNGMSIEALLNSSDGSVWASSLTRNETKADSDPYRGSVRKLARKRSKDEWARVRKMYFGLDDVTATPEGEVFITNSLDAILGKEDKSKYRLVESTGVDIEARCKRAEHIRGLMTALFIEGTVTRGDVEHLVVNVSRQSGLTNEDFDGLVELLTETLHRAGMSVTQSTYGRVRVRVPRCKIHSMKQKRVYPLVCPVIHRARLADMARCSYDVKMITEKGKKQKAAAEQHGEVKQRHVLGPRDFPKWVTVSSSYVNSECYGMRLPDGSFYEPTQNQQVYMTWEQYEARKELKVKYRVDFRIKKSKKRKSKGGGASGGKAFTFKSESSVFKKVAGRK
jgi:hypothetical protein